MDLCAHEFAGPIVVIEPPAGTTVNFTVFDLEWEQECTRCGQVQIRAVRMAVRGADVTDPGPIDLVPQTDWRLRDRSDG